MARTGIFNRIFSFEDSPGDFELLETERGAPGRAKRAANRDGGAPAQTDDAAEELSQSVDENLEYVKTAFHAEENKDLIIRNLAPGGVKMAAVYMTGMASSQVVNDFILRQCLAAKLPSGENLARHVAENVLAVGEIALESKWDKIVQPVLDGMTAVFINGEKEAILVETRGFEKRSISSPIMEKVVLGPQEGFCESLRTNVTLVRRIVRTSDLIAEMTTVGKRSGMSVAVMFRKGVANESLLAEVRRRLSNIKSDYVMGEGMLEQLIESRPLSPLPQMLTTERPDRVAALLMSGHVALLCEGSPFALVVPVSFFTMVNQSEDVYFKPLIGSMVRLVRYAAMAVSMVLPGLYIAIILYNPGMFSTEIIDTIMVSRRLIAMPVALEMLTLFFIYELVRIAGQSVPGPTGNTVGIIGGLLLGQAAVSANLVSSVMIIIVAVSGLGSYALPDYTMQFSTMFVKLAFIVAGWAAGLLGLVVCGVVALAYLCSLKSFGMPMLAPVAPVARYGRRPILRGVITGGEGEIDAVNTMPLRKGG